MPAKIIRPPRPQLSYQRTIAKLERTRPGSAKIMKALMSEFAKDTRANMDEDLGHEKTIEEMERLYDDGWIRFGFDERAQLFHLLRWDFKAGKYELAEKRA